MVNKALEEIVKYFLQHGTEMNLVNHSKQTALHCAAGYGQESVIDILPNNNANAALKDDEEQLPLHCSSGNGNIAIVKKLLEVEVVKAQVEDQDIYGQTALHTAARRGHDKTVSILLRYMRRDGICTSNFRGQMARRLAAGCGSEEVVRLLRLLLRQIRECSDSLIPFFGACCAEKLSTLNGCVAVTSLEDDFEKVPLEKHSRIATIAWPGEQLLYLQETHGSIREHVRLQGDTVWNGGGTVIGQAKLCSPIAATAWQQNEGHRLPSTENGSISILHGWADKQKWQLGAKIEDAASGSVLSVVDFEHLGHRGIRLYYEQQSIISIIRKACWDNVQNASRAENGAPGYYLGGGKFPKQPGAYMSAVCWKRQVLEIRLYLSTESGIREHRYSGGWVQWHITEDVKGSAGPVSAFRWGSD
ncbi:hypothetical protein DSL72_007640 [Monilinia vaccinii-corymbosi]|uniref:Fucose-specific lectin n=1 Tax=Monilinia vaccinii-corymbosi TaxID=61207 RepID=A0A8A3PHM9_9HELO|nr:hypothetical protein DSL72_007640 [Monilinia vaccinii-corymbosi]